MSGPSLVREFLEDHRQLTRRYFMRFSTASALTAGLSLRNSLAVAAQPQLDGVIEKLEPYFTDPNQFNDVSRGDPLPHSLADEKKREVGLTRETWKLEVISDPENPTSLRKSFTKQSGTAIDFPALLKLADEHAVRFAKVMTCLNIGCPLGMGIWEGVPLREIIWLTEPHENLRRVFYYGYHNDDPKQMFRSSLPIGRVLEDYHDLPPVILCYKLNGEWLTSERGGPVRIVVPEAYGFKCIKWLSHVVLTNLAHANDTYADGNNDIDSPLKTFAATLSVPTEIQAHQPIPLTGYAQVGISGLSGVQVWIQSDNEEWPGDDKYFAKAPWKNAKILPPPANWGHVPGGAIPQPTIGFEATGKPQRWPLPLTKVHWAILHPGLPAGSYTLRCRTIDEKGRAQPMPRPFRKSGHSAIEEVGITVK